MDLRGHGRSVCEVIPDRENFPDMMVRLAVDLQEFLVSLDEKSEAPRMCVVGASLTAVHFLNPWTTNNFASRRFSGGGGKGIYKNPA